MTDETNDTESSQTENVVEEESETRSFDSLNKVTPLSKYLAMVLFVLLPFVGGWVGYNYTPGKVVEIEKVTVIEKLESADASEESTLLDLPPFPEKLNWVEVEEFDNNFDVSFSDYQTIDGHIPVTGRLYHATYTVSSRSDFLNYDYIDTIKYDYNLDWQEQLEVGPFTYTAASAGGPTGGQHAVVKQFGGKMMTIVFVDYLDEDCFVESDSGPVESTFPCERTSKIFISDPFDLVEPESGLKTYRNEEYGKEIKYCDIDVVYSIGDCECPAGYPTNVVQDGKNDRFLCPSEGLSPEVMERADSYTEWKTYRNEEYGFEFEYPASWGIYFDEEGKVVISPVKEKRPNHTPMIGIGYNSHADLDYTEYSSINVETDSCIDVILSNLNATQCTPISTFASHTNTFIEDINGFDSFSVTDQVLTDESERIINSIKIDIQ